MGKKTSEAKSLHGDFNNGCIVGKLNAKCSVQDITMACIKKDWKKSESYMFKGLILNPSSNLKVDCYPDFDLAGMYGNEKITNLACVKNRTGYVVTVADCTVLW